MVKKGKKRKRNNEIKNKNEEKENELNNNDNNNNNNNDNNNENNNNKNDDEINNKKIKISHISDITKNEEVINTNGSKVYVILDRAYLEPLKRKNGNFELLNVDDHLNIIRKKDTDISLVRPDILHQELLGLLDSPLNKAGKLQIYIHTHRNVLIYVNPKLRLPRTFKRFAGLFVQLLHRLKIKAKNSSEYLLRVVKNPVTRHLPLYIHKAIGFSHLGSLYRPISLAETFPNEENVNIALVFGAMARGHIEQHDFTFIDEMVSISQYPLSGATAINRVLGAIEQHWGII